MRRFWLIADDYGLSPAVNRGILELIGAGRLSGTGCMTLFDDWPQEAKRLRELAGPDASGLHLTLTDQPALTGESSLAPSGTLPNLPGLVASLLSGRIHARDFANELDAQLERFCEEMQHTPAFIDGHQHVHFLWPVRSWLRERSARLAGRSWLRGAPAVLGSPLPAKAAFVRLLAAGFAGSAAIGGYRVRGPLAGFYDWNAPDNFAPTLRAGLETMIDGTVFMCHPGHTDDILRRRDQLIDARPAELEWLASTEFLELMERKHVALQGAGA